MILSVFACIWKNEFIDYQIQKIGEAWAWRGVCLFWGLLNLRFVFDKITQETVGHIGLMFN